MQLRTGTSAISTYVQNRGKMTDTERVLQLFRQSNGRLISNASIIDGSFFGTKPVLNWSARITDARHKINCNCGQDERTCEANEHIRNVKKNWYQYVDDNKRSAFVVEPESHVNIRDIEQKIERLIEAYKKEKNEWKKSIIKVQGMALRRSLEIEKQNAKVVNEVMESLL